MSDVAARRPEPMTVEAFLDFCDRLPEGEKWELHEGRPVLMTGGTAAHSLIVGNMLAALDAAARGRGCRAMTGFLSRISEHSAFEPDLVVRCGPIEPDSRYATDPIVVVEVLSRSTLRRDRGYQFERYRELPSIRQIVFVYQDSFRIESWMRDGDEWLEEPVLLTGSQAKLTLPEIGATLELSLIYEGVIPTLPTVREERAQPS